MRRLLAMVGMSCLAANAFGAHKTLISEASLRRASDAQGAAAFRKQLHGALADPDHLLRAFPRRFWQLARSLSAVPGKRGYVLGDAGAENIGFLRVRDGGGHRTIFGADDFDDSGRGPVALDADHFFTELRLRYPKKDKLIDRLIGDYVDAVRDPRRAPKLDRKLAPDWDKVRAHVMHSLVRGDAFDYAKNGDLAPAGRSTRTAVERALRDRPGLSGAKVLDVATEQRTDGGSGGLARRLALVTNGDGRRVLELKEAATPGVDALTRTDEPSMRARLPDLTRAFWGRSDATDLGYVELAGKRFLVRDRANMLGLDLGSLPNKQRHEALSAMTAYLAGVHRAGWRGVAPDTIREELSTRSAALAKIYEQSWKALR